MTSAGQKVTVKEESSTTYRKGTGSTAADFDNGEIYKLELDGKILGKFGTAGKRLKEFGSVHELDCRTNDVVFAGELANWRVQKLVLSSK